MDQETLMVVLAHHGESFLKVLVTDTPDYDSDTCTFEEAFANFMKKKPLAPSSVPKPNVLKPGVNVMIKSDPLPIMPAEMYRPDIDKIARRALFYENLMRSDILYLQVINIDDEEHYKCLILAKHLDYILLDDLSLVAYLPKLAPELELLGGDLCKFDLLRAAFWTCNCDKRELYVTLDSAIYSKEEKEKLPALSKIGRKDLPHYVGSKKVGVTYAGYVERSAGYKEQGYCMNLLHECLGVDTKRFSSFFKNRNGKTYPESESLAELQKNLHPDTSTLKLIKSYEYFRNGDMFKALHYANKGIMYNPDNIQARVTRGTVYANLGKLNEAFIDTEDSLKLDPKHEAARKQMSELLVSASGIYLCQKKYLKWHQSLVLAKKYNPNNNEAQELLMKTKYKTRPANARNRQPVKTRPANARNRQPVKVFIPPSVEDVAAIYNRILQKVDKRGLFEQYEKQRKQKRRRERRRRAERRKQRAVATELQGQPIPTTFTTTRRLVSFRSSSPVFRRPFPPRSISRT